MINGSRIINISFGVIFLMLCLVVSILSYQNIQLKNQIEKYSNGNINAGLEPGAQFSSFRYRTLNQEERGFGFDNPSRGTILFILTTRCPHCEKNLDKWNLVTKLTPGDRYEVLGVSLDSMNLTQSYLIQHKFDFPLVCLIDSTFHRNNKISGVPMTFLLDAKGLVKSVWRGEISDEQVVEIRNAME